MLELTVLISCEQQTASGLAVHQSTVHSLVTSIHPASPCCFCFFLLFDPTFSITRQWPFAVLLMLELLPSYWTAFLFYHPVPTCTHTCSYFCIKNLFLSFMKPVLTDICSWDNLTMQTNIDCQLHFLTTLKLYHFLGIDDAVRSLIFACF